MNRRVSAFPSRVLYLGGTFPDGEVTTRGLHERGMR